MITKEQRGEITRAIEDFEAKLRDLKKRYGTPAQEAFEESYRGPPRPTGTSSAVGAFGGAMRRED